MSLFANHLNRQPRSYARMAMQATQEEEALSQEGEVEDENIDVDPPADDDVEVTVDDDTGEVDVDTNGGEEGSEGEGEEEGAGAADDEFAEQRDRLNRNHGMIRNRMFAQEEDLTELEEVAQEDLDLKEDDDENEESDDEDLSDIENDMLEIQDLEAEMSMLGDSYSAIEAFGINPTAMVVLQTTGLLSGTALESLGLEAIQFHGSDEAESLMAMEAIENKIEEKQASWSAKVLSFVKNTGGKILGVLKKIYEKISDGIKSLTTFTWDKTKALGAHIKAHPYKYLIGVAAAIIATVGVIKFAGANFPAGSSAEAVQTFMKNLVSKIRGIKAPHAKIVPQLTDQSHLKIDVVNSGASYKTIAEETVAKAGFTKETVGSLGTQMSKIWSSISSAFTSFGSRMTKLADAPIPKAALNARKQMAVSATKISRSASEGREVARGFTTGIYVGYGLIAAMVYGIYRLIRGVIILGFKIIAKTISALRSAVKPATAEA